MAKLASKVKELEEDLMMMILDNKTAIKRENTVI